MPTTSSPFTKRWLDALPRPDKRVFEWEGGDGAIKGFGVKCEPTGRKTFVFQYSDAAGQAKRITLGAYGTLTLDQGRTLARDRAGAAAAAKVNPERLDPARDKHAAKSRARAAAEAPTMADLFDRFLENREQHGAKKTTLDEYVRVLGVRQVKVGKHKGTEQPGVLRAALGSKRAIEVQKADVRALLTRYSATKTMANQYVVFLSAVFNFAESEDLVPQGYNPCRHVTLYELKPKRQSLRDEDYRSLGQALTLAETIGLPTAPARLERSRGVSAKRKAKATGRVRGPYKRHVERKPTPQNPYAVAMLRFLALTGWRSGEAKGVRWSDFDLARGVVVLPDTKTDRSERPVGSVVIALIEELRDRPDYPTGNPFVFPGSKDGEGLKEFDHVWAAVRHAANLQITPHGLRHAFTTTARYLGYADHVIARLVGHVLNDSMTSRYGDVHEQQVRDAADRISAYIAERIIPVDAEPMPMRRLGGGGPT